MESKKISRRKLIKNTAFAAIAGALYLNTPFRLFAKNNPTTKVILIRDKELLDAGGNIDKRIMEKMLNKAMMELTGTSSASDAWKKIVKPEDIVGVKSNVWNYLRTPVALENIITKKLMIAGVKEGNISVKDRGVLSDDVFKKATALINVRPMRTHNWSGVGSLLKNYIMFSPRPASYHPDTCADLAKLWTLPVVKGKTKLNILVMVTPLFHGSGPHHYNKKYTWKYNGLLVGFDPVAVDSIGVQILKAKRKAYFGEDRPINPPPKHVALADTRHHLGTADPRKIDLVKLGWKEEMLI